MSKIKIHTSDTTLFFVDWNPTPEEIQLGRMAGATFRNIHLISPDENPEPCRYVMGKVIPEQYKKIPKHPISDKKDVKSEEEIYLEALDKEELFNMAEELGFEIDSKMTKAQLVNYMKDKITL